MQEEIIMYDDDSVPPVEPALKAASIVYAILLLIFGFVFVIVSAPSARAGDETVSLLVSHAPGGGYDNYARLFARHAGKFIDGGSSISVRNMPGAAGVVMANHLASAAPRNGSTIALGPGSLATAALFSSPGARYDARDFGWIGSLNNEVTTLVARADAPVQKLDDIFTRELIVGGAGASDNSVIYATVMTRLFGAKFRLVSGYNGSNETVLALERGEVQGISGWNYSSIQSMRPDWLANRKINILLQMSQKRHPELPDVPAVIEIARNDTQRDTLKLIISQSQMGRVLLAPPGLSAAQLAQWRKVFDDMIRDKEFLDDARKARLEINQPMSGEEVALLVAELYKASPENIREAVAALGGS
jgi:tripartite-type tricarboxylate transporter receptor subunit TctC